MEVGVCHPILRRLMQENEENPVNQEDEMPSLDAAHEYPNQEGASVPAEDNGNENRSRPIGENRF